MSENKNEIAVENREWLESIRWVIDNQSAERAEELIELIRQEAIKRGVKPEHQLHSPYVNSIPPIEELPYPGDLEMEEKLIGIMRWNAMAMVLKANKLEDGIGGHISTYNSIADLFEVGFNHFFRGGDDGVPDMVYFQGHAAPGVYARAFLEGRLTETQLENYRRELNPAGGLPSYPHPRFMGEFWNNPTVSMGLAPLMAVYRARFNKYLINRGLIEKNDQKVWVFIGDGEMDEPESTAALSIAAREKLDNLIFIVNCNLQRLDGPVRGNSKIVQELEGVFKGYGWNTLKLLWGSDWDPLFEQDEAGELTQLLTELPDGQFQKFAFTDGAYLREHLFGKSERLKKLVKDYSDKELFRLKRGGHDLLKIFNAYHAATDHTGQPTVILAQTIKGYGQGKSGEASNVTHQQKKMSVDDLKQFRDRFGIALSDEQLDELPFIHPGKNSDEVKYVLKQRKEAGGSLPKREDKSDHLKEPDPASFERFYKGSGEKKVATTMAMVQLMSRLINDKEIGKLIIPIIPDESRTFGIDALFGRIGIYASDGQLYEPVDKSSIMFYKEDKTGVILEEGITEAGSMGSFIAAGSAYASLGINTIPFFFFYSMFGFQRIGDLIWAAADAKAKGFMIGGVSGRTTLPGEGLQHTDGHSQVFALSVPCLQAYDPAFAYEIAVIVQDGIKRMYRDKENIFYYLTVTNQTYVMPEMPKDSKEGILKGMYRFKKSSAGRRKRKAHLFGSGAIMTEVLQAADLLEKDYKVSVDIWSITSYKALYDDAIDTERKNRLRGQLNKERNYIQQCLKDEKGAFVAATDYLKNLPLAIDRWFPERLAVLGTDGFGRSDSYRDMRKHFEVNFEQIAFAVLYELALSGDMPASELKKAAKDLHIDADKVDPREFN
ncbi:pyruvate dehydrogenase (acetyl-transferring), homodimeric type [Olivibacter sp. SDN3]|uniref:pyruvate dehydrogenase (acetyl-transferring), homodimeric type n=1 Tax=Olivibacter sp. SDN3 TaxID=2764720 RepID=UPI0016510DB8|nr:pyruvate dehydrogenase (acetyl-transferring), homodimeric type [Olivibacter sp. SDN3]QNL49639.1 pyruvate dehydrogenase (acetyl-transferring), homodimeric type [Olivibacter sp. SDN3]